jgi:hypothetical protein
MSFMKRVKAILFDFGNTLVLDPFEETITLCSYKIRSCLFKFKCTFDVNILIDAWTFANKNSHYMHCSHFFQEPFIIENALSIVDPAFNEGNKQIVIKELLEIYRSQACSVISNSKHSTIMKKYLEDYQIGISSAS